MEYVRLGSTGLKISGLAQHLTEAVNALELTLTEEEITALEKPYTNSGPSWF